ncbi:MAG TPA: SIMPL domain-containing protein, partial [Roseiflexaceae bacterium]|nr:SIMPL domain-containing protein [Roseiflexaceae bacterium]
MNQRIMLPVGLAIGALILGVLMIMLAVLLVRPAAAQNSVDGVPGRHVTVVGHGQVSGKPDTATVQIGVETEAPTAQEALAQNNTQAALLAAKLQELGIAEADLQTSGFNIFPVYGNDGRQVTGYRVSNSVSVTIRDIENAGTLLDEVVQAGANSVYGISFSIADPQAVLDTGRQQAIA